MSGRAGAPGARTFDTYLGCWDDGLLVRQGDGKPPKIEQWVDNKVVRSVGNTSRGEQEFRIRASADNYTPWGCAK